MSLCLLGLGSNLGDSARWLDHALARLGSQPGIELLRQSRYRETRHVGGPAGQASYLNAAALVTTSLTPHDLLRACQAIENDLGRLRAEHWGPRTLDIDLLLYDDLVLNSAEPTIPHPRMAWRRFVVEPAAEIAADMVHPQIGWTVGRLLENLNTTPWYMALAGPIAVGKSCLAAEIARRTGARLLAEQFDAARLAAFYHNPSGHAWQIELEFLRERAKQLDRGHADWKLADRAAVSDFWFEQSRAFASVWLPDEQFTEFMALWTEMSSRIVRPRLLVMLDAPLETLLARIRERGRPGEERLSAEQLMRLQAALGERTSTTTGPILRLDATDHDAAVIELSAAVEAMR